MYFKYTVYMKINFLYSGACIVLSYHNIHKPTTVTEALGDRMWVGNWLTPPQTCDPAIAARTLSRLAHKHM